MNEFPYQLIFYTEESVELRNIIDSSTYDDEPSKEDVLKLMEEKNSLYCECYYDKRNNEDYDYLLWSLTS